METDIEKIIKKRAEKLPTKVAEAIRSVPWMESANKIAKNNKLNQEQTGLFVIETAIIVLGIESPKKYPINLAENAGLNDDAVVKIAKEVDEQIITPIMRLVEKNNPYQEVKTSAPSNDWKSKVIDITKKYSLNQSQTDKLINVVTLNVSQSKKPDIESVISNLGISRLLAEQIMQDLENRVFEYALKQVEGQKPARNASQSDAGGLKAEPRSELRSATGVESKDNIPKPISSISPLSKAGFDTNTKTPEIKPSNLPMVEKGEVAHDSSQYPASRSSIKETPVSKAGFDTNILLRQSAPRPVPSEAEVLGSSLRMSATSPEVVQQPVPVPRFTAVPISENKPEIQKEIPKTSLSDKDVQPIDSVNQFRPKPMNAMDQKLKVVTTGIKEEVKQKVPEKYTTDPYREPIN